MRSILLVLVLATPAFSQGFYGYADSLYWRAWSADFQNRYDSDLEIDHDWQVGYRAGVGYQTCSGATASWTYTCYGADDGRTWNGVNMLGDTFTSYGDLDYQVHDFEVGQWFCVSQRLQVQGIAGFRWGQIDYTLRDSQQYPVGAPVIGNGSIQATSNTDSYGLRLGGEGRYALGKNFSLIGRGSATGMLSTTENRGSASSLAFTSWDETDDHEELSFDAAAGVAWQCGLLEVSGGYEWNFWNNAIQKRTLASSQASYEDLLLDGAFARVSVNY